MKIQEIVQSAIKLSQEAEEELNKIQTKRLLKYNGNDINVYKPIK